MTSAKVVETSVNVISNSPSQDYTHPDDRILLNFDMTPGVQTIYDFTDFTQATGITCGIWSNMRGYHNQVNTLLYEINGRVN